MPVKMKISEFGMTILFYFFSQFGHFMKLIKPIECPLYSPQQKTDAKHTNIASRNLFTSIRTYSY